MLDGVLRSLLCPAPTWPTEVLLSRLATEADERRRFVQKKANKPWVWSAMDATTRQSIACQVGNRHRESGKALWTTIPLVYREQAMFHTDHYAVSQGVIPAEQHKASTKHARTTNPIERCKNTLRQRVSRLVCATLSCSTKLAHHISSLKGFLCQDHLTKGGAFPVEHYRRAAHRCGARWAGIVRCGIFAEPDLDAVIMASTSQRVDRHPWRMADVFPQHRCTRATIGAPSRAQADSDPRRRRPRQQGARHDDHGFTARAHPR